VANQNGTGPTVEITNLHLQELWRRMPSAAEQMRIILLEYENIALKKQLEGLTASENGTPEAVEAVHSSSAPEGVASE